mgnify:CR=1 FL=1
MCLLNRLGALTTVGPIGVEPRDRGSLAAGLRYDVCSTVAILHAGGRHRDREQQPERVHDDVTFAAFHLLASVVAGFATLR